MNEYAYSFLLISIAVWRLTSLLVREDGPLDMFGRIRMLLGVRYDVNSLPVATNSISRGVLCFWCASMWVSLPGAAGWAITRQLPIWYFFVSWFAISAIAIIIDEIILVLGKYIQKVE